MGESGDALLEILRTGNELRFTFLDRTRPSLTYEQTLEVPASVFDTVAARHLAILTTVSDRLSRGAAVGSVVKQVLPTTTHEIHELAEVIRSSLFPEELLAHIRDFAPATLLIRTNCPLIPWELSRINGDMLGLKLPTGRSLLTQRPLRRLAPRTVRRKVRVLVIADPTGDLPGAKEEADTLVALFESSPYFEHEILSGKDANLMNFSAALASGKFDVVHFAGHSNYESAGSPHGVLALADGPISGQYLGKILERNPPEFFFLNSCNSAIVDASALAFDDLSGIAPNLLRVGVSAVLGAFWPVIDEAAVQIAYTFYKLIGEGVGVGDALNRARKLSRDKQTLPYWLGYSVFGDPNLRLRDDDGWKVPAIRSGGRVAAASTFSGRAALHVSSLHSFLMSAEETDTCAVALACECRRSEAIVHHKTIDLKRLAEERVLRVGIPGRTGSGIFVRKMLVELGISVDRCRFIELDTAEVQIALRRQAVDVTALWYPDLADLDTKTFQRHFSKGPNGYTICVLVGRQPRTLEERRILLAAAATFRRLSIYLQETPRRWATLLADQMGLPIDSILAGLSAYSFDLAGETHLSHLPKKAKDFIVPEVEFLKAQGLLDQRFDPKPLILPFDDDAEEKHSGTESLIADIQWSISSLPLLMGKFLNYFS